MRKKAPAPQTGGLTISKCNVTASTFTMSDAMAGAVKAVAEASSAHARALEKMAERLVGPESVGIQVNGNGNRLPQMSPRRER